MRMELSSEDDSFFKTLMAGFSTFCYVCPPFLISIFVAPPKKSIRPHEQRSSKIHFFGDSPHT